MSQLTPAAYVGWCITDERGRPVLDKEGKLQIHASPSQARYDAERQGRDYTQCTVALTSKPHERKGTINENITRSMNERSAELQRNAKPKPPRRVNDPRHERKRELSRASRHDKKRAEEP
jgi:hypothetical protein